MKKAISFLLALVMALSLLPAAVWAEGEEDYAPFAELTSDEAKKFAEDYVFWGIYNSDEGAFYGIGIVGADADDSGTFTSARAKAAFGRAKASYTALPNEAKAELDAVTIKAGMMNNATQYTFKEVMEIYQGWYDKTTEPYDPFTGLTDGATLQFIDEYVAYSCIKNTAGEPVEYWIDLFNVWDENGDLSVTELKKALDAYNGLSTEAKAALDKVRVKDTWRDPDTFTFGEFMQRKQEDYDNAVNPYEPFKNLTNNDAKLFVNTYLGWERWTNDIGETEYAVYIRDVQVDDGIIVSKDGVEKVKKLLADYSGLNDAAKNELNAVVLYQDREKRNVTFLDWMGDCNAVYTNTVNPYEPFKDLKDADAIRFVENYIDYGRWNDNYWAQLKDVRMEDGELRGDIDTLANAVNAYEALSAAAKAELNSVTLRDNDEETTVGQIMAFWSGVYMQYTSTGATVSSVSELKNGDAKAFMDRYMRYASPVNESNMSVLGVEYNDFGNPVDDNARALMMAAYNAYCALPLSARMELETLIVRDGSDYCAFSERMSRWQNDAQQSPTGSSTELNEAAQTFLTSNGITYDAENKTISIKDVEFTEDGQYLTPTSVEAAEKVVSAWYALNEEAEKKQDWTAISALNDLELYWDDMPVRFWGLMDYLNRRQEETRYSPDYEDYVFTSQEDGGKPRFTLMEEGNGGGNFSIEFPGLTEGVDYTYEVKNGRLTVTVKPGVREHWLAAAKQTEKTLSGNVYFYLKFYAPTGAVKVTSDTGNGTKGFWAKYFAGNERDEFTAAGALHNGENYTGNARAMAAVNRDGDVLTITSSAYESEHTAMTWFDAGNNVLGRYFLSIRVKFEEQFSYEFNDPAPEAVAANHISTTIDSDNKWKVEKSAGLLTIRPASAENTLKELLVDSEVVTTVTLTPPKDGYAIDWNKSEVVDGRKDNDAVNGDSFKVYAFNRNRTVSNYTIVWTKAGAPDITEELTVKVTEAKSFMADLGSDGVGSNPATTDEVGTPPNSMHVAYDAGIGYFYTTYTGGTLPSVEDLQKGVTFQAPAGAKHFRFIDFAGNEDYTYLDKDRADECKNSLQNSTIFDVNRSWDKFHLTMPYVQTNSVQVGDVTVYFASTQLNRARIVEWLNEDKETIGYTYVYGKNGSFVQTVTTPAVAKVTEEITDVTIEGDKDLSLTCNRYPQEGNEKTVYMRLTVNDESKLAESNVIYVPYSYFEGLNWEIAKTLVGKPTIRHYVNGDQAEPEVLEGEYTKYGIRFTTGSFSPFTVTWKENGSSGNRYYYTGSGSSDSTITSGADQTKQAGDIVKVTVKSSAKVQTVYVDGVALSAGDYIISGGTVKLQGTYTVKLAQGSHTLRIAYSDGSAVSTTFTLKGTTAPKTGDAGIAVYAVMALGGCTGAAALAFRRKRGD